MKHYQLSLSIINNDHQLLMMINETNQYLPTMLVDKHAKQNPTELALSLIPPEFVTHPLVQSSSSWTKALHWLNEHSFERSLRTSYQFLLLRNPDFEMFELQTELQRRGSQEVTGCVCVWLATNANIRGYSAQDLQGYLLLLWSEDHDVVTSYFDNQC